MDAVPVGATSVDARDPHASWPEERRRELLAVPVSGRVGTVLVSETDRVRVWHLRLAPGERMGFHRHVLDYFWTVLSDGRARSHYADGDVREMEYRAGQTRHFAFGPGEHMTHDLENTGTTPLLFVTVEFKTGANAALDLG